MPEDLNTVASMKTILAIFVIIFLIIFSFVLSTHEDRLGDYWLGWTGPAAHFSLGIPVGPNVSVSHEVWLYPLAFDYGIVITDESKWFICRAYKENNHE